MTLHYISTSKLHVLESGQFIVRYITDFESLGLDPAQDPAFLELHNLLLEKSPIFNIAIAQIQAKAESEIIHKLDYKRDRKISTLRRAWSVYQHSDDKREKDAYDRIKIVMNKYRQLETENFEAETLGIDNMINELTTQVNRPLTHLLHMDSHIKALDKANDEFRDAFNNRQFDNISTIVYDTKNLKKEIMATYKELAEYVFVMAKRSKNNPFYTKTLSAINGGREYYANIMARRTGAHNETA